MSKSIDESSSNNSSDKDSSKSSHESTSNNSSTKYSSKSISKYSDSSSSNSHLMKRLKEIHKLIIYKLKKKKRSKFIVEKEYLI